ncbi:MAG: hypothetical protein A3H94_07660 [Acidobacteria bacterium RIFCSPLOWO2_02_FULL_60_20]|nr:MAG: hypothetical protein A3H94_07660 [Acidobacteria bacterium RIFCSPLOWO2_02_FULL_60_20]
MKQLVAIQVNANQDNATIKSVNTGLSSIETISVRHEMKSPIFFDGAKLFVSVLEAIYEVRQILVSHLEAFQNTGNVKEKVESDVSNDTLQTTPQGNPGTVLVDDVWMEPGSLCEFFGREKPPTAKFPSLDFVSGSLAFMFPNLPFGVVAMVSEEQSHFRSPSCL